MSHSRNTQAEKSYRTRSDMKSSTEKADLKVLDSNNLMAKAKVLTRLIPMILWVKL